MCRRKIFDMIQNLCILALLVGVQLCTTVESTLVAESGENQYKIICQYHLHTWYAPDFRDYLPQVIDESHCTNIIYIDRVRYSDLSANQSLHDGKKLFYSRVPEFRNKGINVSISFWKFNAYEYARFLGDNAEERSRFVLSLVAFMERNNFNGFDVYWSCRSCSQGQPRDPQHDERLLDFFRQISEEFKPRGFLLSTYVSMNDEVVDSAFNVRKLSEYVDWMTVTVFSRSRNNTALNAPLYYHPGDPNEELTVNWSVNYLTANGVPSEKLVLTSLSIGQSYQLTTIEENGLNAPTNFKRSDHFYEICQRVKNDNWKVVHDTDKRVGTYAYLDNQWISYHDVEDVQRIAEYVVQNKLGGGSFINLNYDDFQDKCGCGKNPLLRTLVQILRNVAGPKSENCT